MYSAITPKAALLFFTSFYQALGRCSDMIAAYAEAVATLRTTTYPDSGFWSVPVLYSQYNVIPFPRRLADPASRYQRQDHRLDRAHPEHIGHVFISYVPEDSLEVDQLQQRLEAAGVPVWRDTEDLWPGDDWRAKVRHAITADAFVFLACFSERSLARKKSHQNEELILAIDQIRQRRPDVPWLIPVRFDDCDIPDLDIGGGRSLTSIKCADLFGDRFDRQIARLITTVLRILPSQISQG